MYDVILATPLMCHACFSVFPLICFLLLFLFCVVLMSSSLIRFFVGSSYLTGNISFRHERAQITRGGCCFVLSFSFSFLDHNETKIHEEGEVTRFRYYSYEAFV